MASSLLLDLNSNAASGPELCAETAREDEELVQGLREASEPAYERLIERFQQPVYNLALRLVNDPGDACDVAQEVFLKVFRNIGRFRGQSTLKTWIYRIAVNEAHNQRRWFARHRSRELAFADEWEETATSQNAPDSSRSPFDHVFDGERHVLIEAALACINPTFREVVVLRDIEELRYDEIAEILQISLGTVKSRIMRGREALRQELTGRLEPRAALRLVPKPAE